MTVRRLFRPGEQNQDQEAQAGIIHSPKRESTASGGNDALSPDHWNGKNTDTDNGNGTGQQAAGQSFLDKLLTSVSTGNFDMDDLEIQAPEPDAETLAELPKLERLYYMGQTSNIRRRMLKESLPDIGTLRKQTVETIFTVRENLFRQYGGAEALTQQNRDRIQTYAILEGCKFYIHAHIFKLGLGKVNLSRKKFEFQPVVRTDYLPITQMQRLLIKDLEENLKTVDKRRVTMEFTENEDMARLQEFSTLLGLPIHKLTLEESKTTLGARQSDKRRSRAVLTSSDESAALSEP